MSAGDGTAKPQDDDIVRSKTIAKVTSTTVSTTYSDGSHCVPCVLMGLLRGDTINTKKVVLKHNDPCKEFIAVSEFKCIYSSN